MVPSVAFKKLTSETWKMFKQDDTGRVVENGVQLLIKHDEWAEIIKAIHSTIFINPSIPGVEKAATIPGVTKGGE